MSFRPWNSFLRWAFRAWGARGSAPRFAVRSESLGVLPVEAPAIPTYTKDVADLTLVRDAAFPNVRILSA